MFSVKKIIKKPVIIAAIIMIVVSALVAFQFASRVNKEIGTDQNYLGNLNLEVHYYCVVVEYCDWRKNDTAIFYYPKAPTGAFIRIFDTEYLFANQETPYIYNTIFAGNYTPNVRQFINPCGIKTLNKNECSQRFIDSLYALEKF